MSKKINSLKIKNNEESSKNKTKNILPLIGNQNKANKNNNLSISKSNNFENIDQTKIQLKGKEIDLNSNITKEKYSNNNEINRNNYKLIYSRNINNESKIKTNNKTENKINNVELINEVGKNEIKPFKIVQNVYKIIFVFRNEDFYIPVNSNSTIKDLRLAISKLINIDIKQISMIYEDKEINKSNDDKTVNIFFNLKKLRSRPIIYIKKKFISNSSSTDDLSNFIFKKNFNNKVKITNFPSITDINVPLEANINNVINNFFKNNSTINIGENSNNENNLYKIEPENENQEDKKDNDTYIISFSSPDLAFDFNRYINSLKLINPNYKDIKSNIISMKKRKSEFKLKNNNNNKNTPKNLRYGIDYNLDEVNLTKRNSNMLKLIRKNYLMRKELKKEKNNSQIFVNVSGPYLSVFDKERLEEKENKKKWINPSGFISCVGKYSGIQL